MHSRSYAIALAPLQKGHDTALRACRLLKDKGINAHFQFSGAREDYRQRVIDFHEEAAALSVAERISITSF